MLGGIINDDNIIVLDGFREFHALPVLVRLCVHILENGA